MKNITNSINKNEQLKSYLKSLLKEDYADFLDADAEPQSIRINTLKKDYKDVLKRLAHRGAELEKLPFSDIGFSIKKSKSPFSRSIDFFKGNFSFQGASSQIPPLVLNPRPGDRVLDMTASPGSKTTQMAAQMENKGFIVVNDSNITRMQALNSNTQRAGMINHCIYYRPGERMGRLYPEYFDKVLLDTPCSGLGTLATHREIFGWWSFEKLQKLNNMQIQLLISAIKCVKVGGEIVYSTCSVAPEENEIIIDRILQKYPVKLETIELPGLENLNEGSTVYKNKKLDPSLVKSCRVWPHIHNMEGFFIARLRKTDVYYNKNNPVETEILTTRSINDPDIKNIVLSISDAWGIDPVFWENYRFFKTRNRIWMFAEAINKFVKEGFSNGGLLLADEKLSIWKLSHQAIQFISDGIKKRRLNLDDKLLNNLFTNGFCALPDGLQGYYALEIKNSPGAVVYTDKNLLKIKTSQVYKV